jgi:hypothetical protein
MCAKLNGKGVLSRSVVAETKDQKMMILIENLFIAGPNALIDSEPAAYKEKKDGDGSAQRIAYSIRVD